MNDCVTSSLGHLHARPPITVDDEQIRQVVDASRQAAQSIRTKMKLADSVVITLTVPLDLPMRTLWELAEPMLLGYHIELDWSKWQGWMLTRDMVGDDFDPSGLTYRRKGEWLVRSPIPRPSVPKNMMLPDEAREMAAKLCAAAEEAERLQSMHDEWKAAVDPQETSR